MPGRHAQFQGRWGLRWIAGAAGVVVAAAAAAIAIVPADASPTPVHVTMGVTGATSSNCSGLALGGSDIYVTPGADLDFQSTLAGVSLLGLQLGLIDISSVANLAGTLVIDPSSTTPKKFVITATKATKVIPQLTSGDHKYTFAFDTVTLLSLLKMPLSKLLPSGPLAAGVKLTYKGTIHVTSSAAKCGVSAQLPGAVVSASAPGLPGVVVSLPAVTVPTLPATLPTVLPSTLPTGHQSGGGTPSGGVNYTPPPKTIPEQVMGSIGHGGGFGGLQPDANGIRQIGSGLTGLVAPVAPTSTAPAVPGQKTKSGRQVELAANNPPAAQLPVVLAILAIIALSLVTATYARLFLLRRNVA